MFKEKMKSLEGLMIDTELLGNNLYVNCGESLKVFKDGISILCYAK